MATWPSQIPFFEDASGAAMGMAEGNLKRSPMSIGPAKVRRRSSAGTVPMTGMATPIITESQKQLFETFFYDDILEGAVAFDGPDPFSRYATATFRIKSWTIRPKGLGWVINADLERLP